MYQSAAKNPGASAGPIRYTVCGPRLAAASITAFLFSLAFLFALAPGAPFTKELGVCEAGAVRSVLSGHLILPYYQPDRMVQVPPLYWWSAALAVRALGWNETALRLPSILAAAATCAIVFTWLAATVEVGAGTWAVVALLSSHYLSDAARQPRMDALLMMFVTGAVVCLERALASAQSRRRGAYLAGAGVLMGLATLTKSFLGLVLPGLVVALYLVVRGRMRELFRWDLIAAFIAGLALASVWYGAAFAIGGAALFRWQIVYSLWVRFTGARKGACLHPFYYFGPRLVGGFLPWSLYLPALCAALWMGRRALPEQVLFAACWFVAIFGFFSTSAGKCVVYILPAFPPIAALTGWLFKERTMDRLGRRSGRALFDLASWVIALGVLAAIGATLALAIGGTPTLMLARMHRTDRHFLAILIAMARAVSPMFVLWAGVWIAAAITVGVVPRSRAMPACAAVGAIALVGTWFWFGALNPALAREQTLKSFAPVVDSTVPAGRPVYYVGQPDCDLAFYACREIRSVRRFSCQPGSADGAQYFIFWQDRFASMPARRRVCIKVLAESRPVDSHGRRLLVQRFREAESRTGKR